MASHGTRNKHSSSSGGSGGRRPGRGRVQKWRPTSTRERSNPAEWPVYVIGNVTFQWNHKPMSGEDEERTAATLAAYVANPIDEPGIPANFRNYQPVWGIVKRGPHVTDSSTSRHADEALHTTVRFSDKADRDNYQGYTVHIYNDDSWQYDPSKYCTWDDRSPDENVDQRVYYNRREAPPAKYYALPANASTQQSATSAAYPIDYTEAQSSSDYSSVPGYSSAQGPYIQPSQSSSSYSSKYSLAPVSYTQAPQSSSSYSSVPGYSSAQEPYTQPSQSSSSYSSEYSSAPVSYTQASQSSSSYSSVLGYSSAQGPYTQPSQSSSSYSSAIVSNVQGAQSTEPAGSSSSTPTYFKETSTGYSYCLLSNGAKIYWSGGKHWYIDFSTNNWVEYTGTLNA